MRSFWYLIIIFIIIVVLVFKLSFDRIEKFSVYIANIKLDITVVEDF
jgi:hypothetical protein